MLDLRFLVLFPGFGLSDIAERLSSRWPLGFLPGHSLMLI